MTLQFNVGKVNNLYVKKKQKKNKTFFSVFSFLFFGKKSIIFVYWKDTVITTIHDYHVYEVSYI